MLVKVYGSALSGVEIAPLKIGVKISNMKDSLFDLPHIFPKEQIPIATSLKNEGRSFSGDQLAITSLAAVLGKEGVPYFHALTASTPIDFKKLIVPVRSSLEHEEAIWLD